MQRHAGPFRIVVLCGIGLCMIIFFAFALSAAEAANEATPANLIANGDLETDRDNDGTPDGWPSASEGIQWKLEDGNRFLRLMVVEKNKLNTVYRLIPLPADARHLRLSYRVRYDDIRPGTEAWHDGRILMKFKDSEMNTLQPEPAAPYFRGTSDGWEERSQTFAAPEGAAALEFMPCLFQAEAGTLDFDDFRLVATEGAESAAEPVDREAIIDGFLAQPPVTPELKVKGSKLIDQDGREVWLQGLSVDSMQWGMGENILWSIHVAIDEWHANAIRLAVSGKRWFEGGEEYRTTVDRAARLCAVKGSYLILDLHEFGAPMKEDQDFWADAAARYANDPAVLMELFNEPHGISWSLWRDGGELAGDTSADVNPSENQQQREGERSVGMQALVDTVRGKGARNIVLIAGLDWGYDLSGILNGYALDDRGGNGIMYVSHIYPWKKDWAENTLAAAEKHPVIITEVGCPSSYEGFQFIPPAQRYPLEGWAEDVIAMMQQYKLHWTGFSFHPTCGPNILSDWDYTPTPFWGSYVKEALAGKRFELKRLR